MPLNQLGHTKCTYVVRDMVIATEMSRAMKSRVEVVRGSWNNRSPDGPLCMHTNNISLRGTNLISKLAGPTLSLERLPSVGLAGRVAFPWTS